jgi:hypothetical protein
MFDIYLTDEHVRDPDDGDANAVYGKLKIAGYSETFIASLAYWTHEQYERHWMIALDRIVSAEGRSALITSFVEPRTEGFLLWWPLYRDGDLVYIQNHILFFDQLSKPFSAEHFWESVGQRQIITPDEGIPISEWKTTVSDLRDCLRRKHQARGKG